MADFLMNLNTHTLAQFLASSANSEAAAKEEIANLDRWIDEADKRCADLAEQLQFEKRRLVELRDRKRLTEVDLANAQAATTVISNELGGRQRRLAELNRINRKRAGLPPFASIPVTEKEGAAQGWVELDLDTIVHIDGEALKEGAVVSIVRKHQESKAKRVCGNCVNRIATPEYPDGWCSWGGFPASANGAGPEHCGKFDPRPVKEVPTFETSNGKKLFKVCGNCTNWSQKGERVDDGVCGGAYRNAADLTCPEFDPIPLPQTPPAEEAKTAESKRCQDCKHHSVYSGTGGLCRLSDEPKNLFVERKCVDFVQSTNSWLRPVAPPSEAVEALDQLPTPEEMEVCDDPRR